MSSKIGYGVSFFALIIGVIFGVAIYMTQGRSTDIRSQASNDTALTAGDDIISLEQDLNNLTKQADQLDTETTTNLTTIEAE